MKMVAVDCALVTAAGGLAETDSATNTNAIPSIAQASDALRNIEMRRFMRFIGGDWGTVAMVRLAISNYILSEN